MELHAPVEAEYRKLDVQPQADPRIETQLLVKLVEMKDRIVGVVGALADIPNVSQVEEGRAMHHAPYRETQFEVGLQLHIARLYREGAVRVGHRTLPQRTGRPAAHAVATAAIELAVERNGGRIAVSHRHAAIDAADECRGAAQHDLAADAQVGTEIL